MRSLACLVILILCCLAFPGCAVFNKKTADSKTPATGAGSGTPPAQFPTSTDPLINGGNASQGTGGAVLAGRVIDNYSKPPANTSIRLVSMDGKEAGNPTEVQAMQDGYFIIQGLKPGANYKLLARGKSGDHVLAGITYTRAPNVTVVIQVKEDLVTSGTPDVPGSPAFQDKKPAKTASLDNPGTFANADTTVPAMGLGGPRGGNEIDMPAVNVPVPSRVTPPPVPSFQGWVPGPSVAYEKGNVAPPSLDIPNPTSRPPVPALLIPETPSPMLPPLPSFPEDGRLDGPARVPSCIVLGKRQLVNLALNDVRGTPWEFKSNRTGKLVLIDIWSTTCVYCRELTPALTRLQTQYGAQGLEVLGIAVEPGGSFQERAYQVSRMATSMHVNYRQLVSTSAVCPVCREFGVDGYPTLILVDQKGSVLWRHTGKPDADRLDVLGRIIRSELSKR